MAGCHIGSCHYGKGNYITAKRVAVMKDLLGFFGLSPKRIRLEWIATSESKKFANVISEFTQEITQLGPSPMRKISWNKKSEKVVEPLTLQP